MIPNLKIFHYFSGRASKNTGLRRSDDKAIERAKIRTLRMTIMIVVVFVVCWTPYVVLTLWYATNNTIY